MNTLPLALIGFILASVLITLFGFSRLKASPGHLLVGLVSVIFLFAIALAGGFGFLASFELPSETLRLPWQIGYGLIGGSALVTAAFTANRAFKIKRM